MIFCYWAAAEHDAIRESVAAWRDLFPDFRITGDSDVEPLIARDFPDHLDAYRKIRIPACKSDIARLVALRERGGLYVDCHCGIGDAKHILQLMDELNQFELIVVDEDPKYRQPHLNPLSTSPMNGIMFAQKNSEILSDWTRRAFLKLTDQRAAEKENGFSPYVVWALTGAGSLSEIILDREPGKPDTLKASYSNRVKIIPEQSSPIIRNVYRSYRQPGMHWHARERHELLFS